MDESASRGWIRAATRRAWRAAGVLALAGRAAAQDPNACDAPGEYADLILGDLEGIAHWGTVGEITAYSIGAKTCNLGTCQADWIWDTAQHPVFGENLFRLEDGRFEQLGQAWVTHRFFALSQTLCEPGCIPTNGVHLGVDCSTYDAPPMATGGQQFKGAKFEVDASTGSFAFPYTGQGGTGNSIYKRLQVRIADLDPGLHPDALYFIEGQNVSQDDATGGGVRHNNPSWRQVLVVSPTLDLQTTGATVRELPAIHAWAAHDPEVVLEAVDVPGDGRFFVASRATPLGGGTWHYEYAIHNLDSHRSAMSVGVPIPHGVTVGGIGFHDVDYHSGEPFDGTDWGATVDSASIPNAVRWATQSVAEDPDANALRWGTLYNFRFDADVPPSAGEIVLGLFRTGTPGEVAASAVVPEMCDAGASCEPGETPCNCAADCGVPAGVEAACADGQDEDCDGLSDCADGDCCGVGACPSEDADADAHLACEDCDDLNPGTWATPGEVTGLLLDKDSHDRAILAWSVPAAPGGDALTYETIRSTAADDFLTAAVCLDVQDPTATTAVDREVPAPGGPFHYLVRAANACGVGSAGQASDASTQPIIACP